MADFYWVGGTGNWSDFTNRWRIGGTGGSIPANAPTSTDNVFFVDASAAGTFTVTVDATSTCANFDANGITDAAKKMTLAGSSALGVYGSWTNPISTYYASTYSGTITFASTSAGNTITVNAVNPTTGSITFDGVNGGWTLGGALTLAGAVSAVTLTNGALDLGNYTLTAKTFSSSNSNTRSIAFGSSGNITLTGVGVTPWGCATITNFSYTGTSSVTVTGGTNIQHGSTAGGSEALALNFTITGSSTTTFAAGTRAKNITFSAYTASSAIGAYIYENITLVSGMTVTAQGNYFRFEGSTAGSVITNGVTIDQPIWFNKTNSLSLADNLTTGSTRLIYHTGGIVSLNGNTLTGGNYQTAGATARGFNFGSNGIIRLTGSAATIWDAANSNWSYSGTGVIDLDLPGATIFKGNGFSYPTLYLGGSGALTITGNNTFSDITNDNTVACTATFTAGTTQTVSAFSLSGSLGNLVTIQSSSAGSQFTLSDSAGTNSVSYCSIKDSAVTGGADWQSYTTNGNVDAGNNTGWAFNVPVTYSYSSDIKLRSMAQRGRF